MAVTQTPEATGGVDYGVNHVAIIMDGNGRWAKNRGWPRLVGHRRGAERVKEIEEKDFAGQIDIVAQNVKTTDFEDPVFKPYVIKIINGVPVAIVGQAFPYTPIANPRWQTPDWSFGIRDDEMQLAVDAARLAASHGLRIHTIALGPEDLETRPTARDAVDVATLRAVAETAGGALFRVRDTADLTAMAQALDRLEPSPGERPPLRYWRSLWIWPAMLCAACLMLAAIRRRE